jgi:predicted acylesterase/phospholipase RssA
MTVESSVADPIWDLFHLPYKAFFKPVPFTVPFLTAARMFRIPGDTSLTRLYNDTLDFWAATLTPSLLTPASLGLCQPEPFLSEVIDFEKMRTLPGQFYMNAYNMTTNQMEEFGKEEIDERHVWAALAFPFVYEPVAITRTVDGEEEEHWYSEGSDRDPINLPNLHARIKSRDVDPDTTVVLMDVLGSLEDGLVRVPRNLMDAYSISIMTPIVSLAKKNKEEFYTSYQETDADVLASQGIIRPSGWKPAFKEYRELKFNIPEEKLPYIADWSHSNMAGLFEIGKAAGEKFVDEHGDLLPDLQEA